MSEGVRKATHAGTWYSSSKTGLSEQLTEWLSVPELVSNATRAIIAPHAGYSYSGPTAAYAYKQINPEGIIRVFLLGPSHHVYLSGCALSQCKEYETPLGNFQLDLDTISELHKTKAFDKMDKDTDEDEHSIELHLPFLYKVMERNKTLKIVPILVGSLSDEKEQFYGEILSKYLRDPHNLFVISSDFCHWGKRFSYTYIDDGPGEIYNSIERLDKKGMDLIENLDCDGFSNYLKKFRNTICGRHPIGVLLQATQICKKKDASFDPNIKFVKYAQSSHCHSSKDSSVSYASAFMTAL